MSSERPRPSRSTEAPPALESALRSAMDLDPYVEPESPSPASKSARSMPPTKGGRPSLPPSSKRGDNSGSGGSDAQLDDEGQPLIDYKGRSKPLYSHRRERPKAWRPNFLQNLALGLIPGARLMAHSEIARGTAFAALGVVSAVPAILVLTGWRQTLAKMHELAIDERWTLLHASIALASIVIFELLRLVSGIDGLTGTRRGARVLSAFALPCALILFLGPQVVRHSARAVEALWFSSLVLGLGAIIAALYCVIGAQLASEHQHKRFVVVGGIALVALSGVLLVTGVSQVDALRSLGALAEGAGFRVLPDLLRAFAG